MTIGQTLKMFRVGMDIKQRDFAKRLNISANYLYLLEKGKKEPSLAVLKKAAEELGVPLSFLFLDENISGLGEEAKAIYDKIKALIFQVQTLKQHNKNDSE